MFGLSLAADAGRRLAYPPSSLTESRRERSIDNLVLLHPNCHRQVHSEGMVLNKTASREGR